MDRAIHWFPHKVNVDLVDTLQVFKAAACLMCPATAPLGPPPLEAILVIFGRRALIFFCLKALGKT